MAQRYKFSVESKSFPLYISGEPKFFHFAPPIFRGLYVAMMLAEVWSDNLYSKPREGQPTPSSKRLVLMAKRCARAVPRESRNKETAIMALLQVYAVRRREKRYIRTCTQRLFIRNPKESQPILAPLLVKNKLFIRLDLSYFPLILIFHDAKLGVLSETTKCLGQNL